MGPVRMEGEDVAGRGAEAGRVEAWTEISESMKETSAEDLFLLAETAGETCRGGEAAATLARGERRR